MTRTPIETDSAIASMPTQAQTPLDVTGHHSSVAEVLEQLFVLYPGLFGANFLPLKLGVFQELLASHPQQFERQVLKAALAQHTRSNRYLHSVAAGIRRHDLLGNALEPVAPEHVSLAIIELFRRRQKHSSQDLRPKLKRQLMNVFVSSGLTPGQYLEKININNNEIQVILDEAFAERRQQLARQQALRSAFDSSGKTLQEFADMYGMKLAEVSQAIEHNTADSIAHAS